MKTQLVLGCIQLGPKTLHHSVPLPPDILTFNVKVRGVALEIEIEPDYVVPVLHYINL